MGVVEVGKNLVSLQGELSWVTRLVNDHGHGVALRAIMGTPWETGWLFVVVQSKNTSAHNILAVTS